VQHRLAVTGQAGAASVSRSLVYRLIKRGVLPSKTFGMAHYVRGEDFAEFVRCRGKRT
jgi:hypothetical protein